MYDVIVVGGGLAGMCSATACAERSLRTLLVSRSLGGKLLQAPSVTLPGLPGTHGPEIARRLGEQAKAAGVELIANEISAIRSGITLFTASSIANTAYKAKAVIVASGAMPHFLGVAGEDEFLGKGITTRPLADLATLEDRPVAVIGFSESSARLALFLSAHCPKVHLLCPLPALAALPATRERLRKNLRVEVRLGCRVSGFSGSVSLESVQLDGGPSLAVEGLAIAESGPAQTEFARYLDLAMDEYGRIRADARMRTSAQGVFACGDASSHHAHGDPLFVAAHAQRAAMSAYEYLRNK